MDGGFGFLSGRDFCAREVLGLGVLFSVDAFYGYSFLKVIVRCGRQYFELGMGVVGY